MARVHIYEWGISLLLVANIIYYPINEDYLEYLVPKEICGYSFWLSLGLFVGFKLCKSELKNNIKSTLKDLNPN